MHETNIFAWELSYDLRKVISGHFRVKFALMQTLLNTANKLKKLPTASICYEE